MKIIFLISLPRSGSTMLQHLLASHSQISSCAEPWLLLPHVYSRRGSGIDSEYDSRVGAVALNEFISAPEVGESLYNAAVRQYVESLFSGYSKTSAYFLIKTSRNYLIVPELIKMFPDAKFIFLFRHPAAIFCSYYETMSNSNLTGFFHSAIRNDIKVGYQLLYQGMLMAGERGYSICYESIVDSPNSAIRALCSYIDVEFEEGMLRYGLTTGVLPGKLVDPKSIKKHNSVVDKYKDSWQHKYADNSEIQSLMQSYVMWVGPRIVKDCGYGYDEAVDLLCINKKRLNFFRMRFSYLMQDRFSFSTMRRFHYDLIWAYNKGGVKRTAKMFLKQIFDMSPLGMVLLFFKVLRVGAGKVSSFRCRRKACSEHASSDYSEMDQVSAVNYRGQGWQSGLSVQRQLTAYKKLINEMVAGHPRKDLAIVRNVVEQIQPIDSLNVLEVGCGNGYYLEVFDFYSPVSVDYTGLDYSNVMIESAKSLYPNNTFVCGNATSLPFADNSYDVVWCGTVIMHVENYAAVIAEAKRVARLYVVFHSTPLLCERKTAYYEKKAYGENVFEVVINRNEFEMHLAKNHLYIKSIIPSLPYVPSNVCENDIVTWTYLCSVVPDEHKGNRVYC